MANIRALNTNPSVDAQVAALKLPPHSVEAEQSLIGGLLIDNRPGTGLPTWCVKPIFTVK